jgi:hypothetical protein
MTKIPNGTEIMGTVFYDSTYVDTSLQEWCPLEHTDIESYCQNEYHNVQLRAEGVCAHSAECFALRARYYADKLDKLD